MKNNLLQTLKGMPKNYADMLLEEAHNSLIRGDMLKHHVNMIMLYTDTLRDTSQVFEKIKAYQTANYLSLLERDINKECEAILDENY